MLLIRFTALRTPRRTVAWLLGATGVLLLVLWWPFNAPNSAEQRWDPAAAGEREAPRARVDSHALPAADAGHALPLATSAKSASVRLVAPVGESFAGRVVLLHVGDGREPAEWVVQADEEGELFVEGDVPWWARLRAHVDGRDWVVSFSLPAASDDFRAGARAAFGAAKWHETATLPLERDGAETVLEFHAQRPRARLAPSLFAAGNRVERFVLGVRELLLGRTYEFKISLDDESEVEVPSDVDLEVYIAAAKGMRAAGGPPPQLMRLATGQLIAVRFDMPEAIQVHVQGLSPRKEHVAVGLLLWREAEGGALEPCDVADGLEDRGSAGFVGRLAPGRYVGLALPRVEYGTTEFELDLQPAEPNVYLAVPLPAGEDLARVELALADPAGEPIPTTHVVLQRAAGSPLELDLAHGRTDPHGRVVLRGVRPGRYRLAVFERRAVLEVDLAAGERRLDLVVPNLDEVGEPTASIRGSIRDPRGRGIGWAWLLLRGESSSWWRLEVPRPDGTFDAGPLPVGLYEAWVPVLWSRATHLEDHRSHVLVQEEGGDAVLHAVLAGK